MNDVIYIQNIKFADLKAETQSILDRIDAGEFDEELARLKLIRPADQPLTDSVTLTAEQGLSPEQWAEIAVAFAPFANEVCTSLWKQLVVPLLKRAFREDQIKSSDE